VSTKWLDVYATVEATRWVGSGLKVVTQKTAWVTEPVMMKLKEVSDPLVERVDENLKPVYKVVEEKVLTPAKENGELNVKGIASAAVHSLTSAAVVTLSNRYELLVESADEVVEYWIPPEIEENNAEDDTLKSTLTTVAQKAGNRISQRVVRHYSEAKHYSEERLRQIVPVDLLEYSKNMSENSCEYVLTAYEHVKIMGAAGAQKISRVPEYTWITFEATFYFVSDNLRTGAVRLHVFASAKLSTLIEQINSLLAQLKGKVAESNLLGRVDTVVETAVDNFKNSKVSEFAISRGKAVFTESELRVIAFYQSLLSLVSKLRAEEQADENEELVNLLEYQSASASA